MPNSAVNILLDCTCSMTFSATDQGGGETFGGAVSFLADRITVQENINSADHSTSQDRVENHRLTKVGWEMTVETKLYPQTPPTTFTLLSSLRGNDLGFLTVTSTGAGYSGPGLIIGLEVDYAGPSTLKFTLRSHGQALSVT